MPSRRRKGWRRSATESEDKTPAEKHAAMACAKRLKRVFGIDVQTCETCGGAVRIIAAVEDPVATKKILDHLEQQGAMALAYHRPAVRVPPKPQRLARLHH